MNVRYDTAKNWRILVEYTGPIFWVFLPYESNLCRMMDLYLIFQFVKGCCHGNQIMLQNCYQCRLIPLGFVAIVLENKLQYHGLAVRIKSENDACVSCENLVQFSSVTPQWQGSFVNVRYNLAKNWRISSNISASTRPIFTIFTPYESALGADDKCGPYFPIC